MEQLLILAAFLTFGAPTACSGPGAPTACSGPGAPTACSGPGAPTACSGPGAPTACRARCVPGAPCDVSAEDSRVLKVALSAAEAFNSQSDDSFLFKPQRVVRAQKQVVRGVRFILDLDLCRTVCRKRHPPKKLLDCGPQAPGPLHQVLQCHVEVWNIPWKNSSVTQRLSCKDLDQSESSERGLDQSESTLRSGSVGQGQWDRDS
ncbi:cystatin-F-like, partial [Eucyclogobius newberryi]|uniref:cystatin-F-like n=1 Tax=Eucyclogobius newberryi TaxID=166745 RepID=UPI003B5C5717